MKYKIEFQYKPEGRERPYEEVQEERLVFEHGEFFPIPDVGDSVEYTEDGTTVARKVLSRHFGYLGDWCAVTLVVTDIDEDEMAARLKM